MQGCTRELPGESLSSAESTEGEDYNLLFSVKIGPLKIGQKSSCPMNQNSSYTRVMVRHTVQEVKKLTLYVCIAMLRAEQIR